MNTMPKADIRDASAFREDDGESNGNEGLGSIYGPMGDVIRGSGRRLSDPGERTKKSPEELLDLAHGVYAGLTDDEVEDVENAALDASSWRVRVDPDRDG